MDAGIRSLEKLGKAFDKFYMFAGNHDLYYKDKRDIKSTEWAKHIPGITVVDEIKVIDDVALVPWLVGDEWKRVKKLECKYMFGHFELPTFLMNAMVRMPDHGELTVEQLAKPSMCSVVTSMLVRNRVMYTIWAMRFHTTILMLGMIVEV